MRCVITQHGQRASNRSDDNDRPNGQPIQDKIADNDRPRDLTGALWRYITAIT